MDIIIQDSFEKFINEYGITSKNTQNNFEKFINYICFNPKNITNFNLISTCVGAGNDAGIDGIAIAINNRYISDITELDSILDKGMTFNVDFFFVQTKTSESFECKEISTFGDGVVDMFKTEDELKKTMNETVLSRYKIIRKIIKNYAYIIQKRCFLYYITPGTYIEDGNLISTKNRIKEQLIQLDIFKEEDIQINLEDKDFIKKQYQKTKIQNSATFQLNSKIDIPYIKKVEEAYFAIMPIKEYFKIVLDENLNVRKGIFELNVRDFMGTENNRVNKDIVNTLDSEDSIKFGLLNNGITIVGKSLKKMQGKYTISNFYVVNGCQTTNVLCENIDKINNEMWISVKIVITQNDEIINDIVKATNNQTEVDKLQLLSMDEYQKELESFYNSYKKYTCLYYERRSGQYKGNTKVDGAKIINPEIQMKSFVSIFLQMPNTASRFAGKLQEEINKKIFNKEQKPIIYYTAGLIHYKLEKEYLNEKIVFKYNKFKFHIQMLIAHCVWKGKKMPPLNSKKIEDYCEMLIKQIENETNFNNLVQYAIKCIDIVVKNINDTEISKSAAIVNQLILYSTIQWTLDDIKQAKYFNNNIENYSIPFENMIRFDGDKRYNFKKNLSDLNWFISTNIVASKLINKELLKNIEMNINEDDRVSRKEQSRIVYDELLRIIEIINNKLHLVNVVSNKIA